MFVWGYHHAKNLLAYENLQLIADALEVGPIFGMFYRSHSGQGVDYWIGATYADFQQAITNPKPGDEHIIWSLPALVTHDKAVVAARYADLPSGSHSLFSAANIRAIEEYLSDRSRKRVSPVFWSHTRPRNAIAF